MGNKGREPFSKGELGGELFKGRNLKSSAAGKTE
jgi:hypothetical protein